MVRESRTLHWLALFFVCNRLTMMMMAVVLVMMMVIMTPTRTMMVIFANHGDHGDEDDGNGNVRPCLLPVTDWLFLEQLR